MSCTSPINTWDVPRPSGQGMAVGNDRERSFFLFYLLLFSLEKKKKTRVQVSFQRVSPSHGFFSHLWSKKQFSETSREPSRLEQQETEEGSKVPAGRGGEFSAWMRIAGNVQPREPGEPR